MITQAERILGLFGGASRLHRILRGLGRGKNVATYYKWTYPKEKGGCGGQIPTQCWPDILLAARVEGIHITSEDMDPRAVQNDEEIYE